MKLNKDIKNSVKGWGSFYDVDMRRYILIHHDRSNCIEKITLVKLLDNGSTEVQKFAAVGNLYLENVCHGEDNEILDTNLLCMAERCFSEVC